jgi:hypothetical protein
MTTQAPEPEDSTADEPAQHPAPQGPTGNDTINPVDGSPASETQDHPKVI